MIWFGTEIFLAILASMVGAALYAKFAKSTGTFKTDEASLGLFFLAMKLLPDEEKEFYGEAWFADMCSLDTSGQRMRFAVAFSGCGYQMRLADAVIGCVYQMRLADAVTEPLTWVLLAGALCCLLLC